MDTLEASLFNIKLTYKHNLREESDAPVVYHDENKTGKAMPVDISELNEATDISGDDRQNWF